MKKILFPLDRKVDNRHTFSYAAKLAKASSAELIILHAFVFEVDEVINEDKYKKRLQQRWLEIINEVMKLKSFYISERDKIVGDFKLKFDYHIVFGKLKTELFKLLKEEEIDLIVYTLPYENDKSVELTVDLLKSIFQDSKVPVLVVPEHHPFVPINKILYSVDFKKNDNSGVLFNYINNVAGCFDAAIHFLYVSSSENDDSIKNKEDYAHIQHLIKSDGRHSFNIVAGNDVAQSIGAYAIENGINMIAAVKQNRNFLESLFFESITDRISFYTREPVLILHEIQNS